MCSSAEADDLVLQDPTYTDLNEWRWVMPAADLRAWENRIKLRAVVMTMVAGDSVWVLRCDSTLCVAKRTRRGGVAFKMRADALDDRAAYLAAREQALADSAGASARQREDSLAAARQGAASVAAAVASQHADSVAVAAKLRADSIGIVRRQRAVSAAAGIRERAAAERARTESIYQVSDSIAPRRRLRPAFRGDDIRSIYAQHRVQPRGEFETSEAYVARLARLPVGTVAIPIDPSCAGWVIRFDADAQAFLLGYYVDGDRVEVRCARHTAPSYIARNAMNARWRVSVHVDTTYSLSQPSPLLEARLSASDWRIPVPLAQAPLVRSRMRLLAVASLLPASSTERIDQSEVTVSSPIDRRHVIRTVAVVGLTIWAYDAVTGRVFSKWRVSIPCPSNENNNCPAGGM